MKRNRWKNVICVVFFSLYGLSVYAGSTEVIDKIWSESLALELESMADEDQAVREKFSLEPLNDELAKAMSLMDSEHEKRVSILLREHGWPKKQQVGERGLHSLWVLIQHGSPELLSESLPFMKISAEAGEIPWPVVALSIDRDLINRGKPQIYGTQFRLNSTELEIYPLENADEVDVLRKRMGLESLKTYKDKLRDSYGNATSQ